VRALASHQCGSGSNPGVGAICGLSLLLVLSFAPRGFSPGTPVFPSPRKPAFQNSNSTRNQVDEEQLCGCATSKALFIYIYFIYLFIYFVNFTIRCIALWAFHVLFIISVVISTFSYINNMIFTPFVRTKLEFKEIFENDQTERGGN